MKNISVRKYENVAALGLILTVPSQDVAIPPVRVLLIELQAQLLHEHPHHALVGVRVAQAYPDIPVAGNSNDHADPWSYRLLRDRAVGIDGLPMHAPEVRLPQPCLVAVDHGYMLVVYLQEVESKLLPEHQGSLGVATCGGGLQLPVP